MSHWRESSRHLSGQRQMRAVMKRVGKCTLKRRTNYYESLCEAIFSQQLSVKIADILFARFRKLFPGGRISPKAALPILSGDPHVLKRCGLSRQKHGYLIDLSKHFVDGRIPTRRLSRMTDDEVIECLTDVKGIGKWTAEMFLIFVLNRPDVWPADDLGLQEACKRYFKLRERPKAKEVVAMGDRFRPHRTLATWYLWRSLSLDKRPVKKK